MGPETTPEVGEDREVPADSPVYRDIEEELRAIQSRRDGLRTRMRGATDLAGLVLFGVALVGLVVVTTLAVVSFNHGQDGVGMLFSGFVLVALPVSAAAAWRAFGPLWTLGQQLAVVRRRESELYEQLASAGTEVRRPRRRLRGRRGAAVPGGAEGQRRQELLRRGFRRVAPARGAILWVLVAGGTVLLLFVIGISVGQSQRG